MLHMAGKTVILLLLSFVRNVFLLSISSILNNPSEFDFVRGTGHNVFVIANNTKYHVNGILLHQLNLKIRQVPDQVIISANKGGHLIDDRLYLNSPPKEFNTSVYLHENCSVRDYINPILVENLLYRYSLTDLETKLPYVYVLPLSEKASHFTEYYRKTDPGYAHSFFRGEWSHAIRYLDWFENYYRKTVKTGINATAFFFPYWIPLIFTKDHKFIELEAEIVRFLTENRKEVPHFALDRVFMAVTFPLNTILEKGSGLTIDNIPNFRDIRLLRCNEDLTTNGRDIMVSPLVEKCTLNMSTSKEIVKRELFLFAPCKVALGPHEFRWREKVFQHWKNEADVVTSMDYVDFNLLASMSDFCAIIPGDMSTTSKLEKAIFEGCIPVVFVSYFDVLSFSHFVDWSLFSIVLLKDIIYIEDGMQELLRYLRWVRMNSSVLLELKENLLVFSRLIDVDVKDWPSMYHFAILQLVEDLDTLPRKRKRSNHIKPFSVDFASEFPLVDHYLLKRRQ